MAHETIIYGFIGAERTCAQFRQLQKLNGKILSRLPEFDDYPFLTRSMFSFARQSQRQGNFREQVIHFGGSVNGLQFDEVPMWVDKFEGLLSRLYWYEAIAHLWTDIDGCYTYRYLMGKEILQTHHSGNPQPTSKWIRYESREGTRYIFEE